jgi:hypothetical protein
MTDRKGSEEVEAGKTAAYWCYAVLCVQDSYAIQHRGF